jgi:hypothetical protein
VKVFFPVVVGKPLQDRSKGEISSFDVKFSLFSQAIQAEAAFLIF